MSRSEYKIDLRKLRKPKIGTIPDALYQEHKINSRKQGNFLLAYIYTDKERRALHSFLRKYNYNRDLLNELFNKEHLELKENKNSIDMRKNNKLNESKNDVLDEKVFDDLGVRPQSVAKIIGTVFQREFIDEEKPLNLSELYENTVAMWDDIIDEYDKSNEKTADEKNAAEKKDGEPDLNVAYELDEALSDGSVSLETIGVKNVEDFAELLDILSDLQTIDDIVKDTKEEDGEAVEWKDDTNLDGNDAIESFCKLIDEYNSTEPKQDDDDADNKDGGDTDIEESHDDFITESIKNGAEFVKIEDIEKDAYERGRLAGLMESKEVTVVDKKSKEESTIEYEDKAPKGTKKSPVSAKELKECKSKNIIALRAMLKDASVDTEIKKRLQAIKVSSSCDEIQSLIEDISKLKGKIYKDIVKCLNVICVCTKTLGKANESVTANFAKYRKLFEAEDSAQEVESTDKKDDKSSTEDTHEPDNKEEKPADDNKEENNEDCGEGDKIVLSVKKKEGSDVEDFVEQLKKDLIEAGVEEDDIEVVEKKKKDEENTEEEKKDEEIKVKIDGNSIKALLEFGKKHNIDIEELSGCEFDIEDDDKEDNKDDNKDDDKEDKGDDKKEDGEKSDDEKKDETPGDSGITDDMWANIFGEE